MSNHTPGPWQVVSNVVRTPVVIIEDRPHGGYMVAECSVHVGRDEYQANARLIAAAPDLLIALRGCASELLRTLQRETDEVQREWLKTARDTALVALAKAAESSAGER